jgi:hypothetical protein
MNFAQLLAKVKDTPVLCIDGNVGMLVSYPCGDAPSDPAGIQVPGEPELRWLPQERLQPAGSALKQEGSPRRPLICARETAGEHARLACNLLGELWIALQPQARHAGLVLSWPD